jgi:hypothetical protein
MTFVVRGTKGEEVATAVRLRAVTAVAKAREFAEQGFQVFIDCPDGKRNYPDDFDNMLSETGDDETLPSEGELGVAI